MATDSKPNISTKDIIAVIKAGKVAKCSKIEYNGLIITFAENPASEVPVWPDYRLKPLAENKPATPQELEEAAIIKQLQAARDLDTALLTDPVRYEELVHEEDIDVSR
jgi:hypothetical protein